MFLCRLLRKACLLAVLGCVPFASALGDEKSGMPDLSQVDQTCLPTSTANLLLWFGHHGYPKLIASGSSTDERELHTVHCIMSATEARFDLGTQMDDVTDGIEKYIHDCGYQGEVEYRGINGSGPVFNSDWLTENDDPNKGFILLLLYCQVNPENHKIAPSFHSGHAVTLVNAEPGMLLVNDPAHDDDQTGRKILTPHFVLGSKNSDGDKRPGFIFLTGSLLNAPPSSVILLAGAVRVTMHPEGELSKKPAPPVSSAAQANGGKTQSADWFNWLAGVLGY